MEATHTTSYRRSMTAALYFGPVVSTGDLSCDRWCDVGLSAWVRILHVQCGIFLGHPLAANTPAFPNL